MSTTHDDSDIDDLLDDVLDNMKPEKTTKKTTVTGEKDEDEFSKQLAAGMENLMGQFDQEKEMKETFEKVWASMDDTEKEKVKPQNFQDAIGKTMNKLKDSSKEVNTSITEDSEEAFMEELMKQMETLADNGEFENVLEGMMSQLMSKDLLYEPMKDLAQKYPEWLKNNKEKTKQEDYEKFQKQFEICKQIVASYEAPEFDEKNDGQAKKITDLMTKMQELGQPPAELLNDMAPGTNFGNPNAMPDMKDLENSYCATLVLLATQTQAIAQDDVSLWTQDQAKAYLEKYQITYDNNIGDENLLNIVKKYRDAALANANVFINNKADSVNSMVDTVKQKLTDSYKLSSENTEILGKEIQHSLKQLELSGSLTGDKVKQTLDRLQHKVVKQKILTEAQFKKIALEIESQFVSPSWYQRLLGWVPTTSDLFPEDSYHVWLKSTISKRLEENKELTREQIESVVATLKQAIASSSNNLAKLGDADWWASLSRNIESNARLGQDQTKAVVDLIKDDVTAYKIFAIDYAKETAQDTQAFVWRVGQYIMDTGHSFYRALVNPAQPVKSAVSQATDSATSVTDQASKTASSLHAQATNSFADFWRNTELESYRALGYTDAHIEWIQNYLRQTFSSHKDWTKEKIIYTINTIRQYLVQTKVQTTSQIDSQLKSLQDLIHDWVKKAHDEL